MVALDVAEVANLFQVNVGFEWQQVVSSATGILYYHYTGQSYRVAVGWWSEESRAVFVFSAEG